MNKSYVLTMLACGITIATIQCNEHITIKKGHKVTRTLAHSSGTAYNWQCQIDTPNIGIDLKRDQSSGVARKKSFGGMVGGPSNYQLTITGHEAGRATVTCNLISYVNQDVAKTIIYNITVTK